MDVVTTGTFGAMCSSGAFLNFGHADPPIKMEKIWLNDVEAYGGIAAVDAYIGATRSPRPVRRAMAVPMSLKTSSRERRSELRALSTGTDCYPKGGPSQRNFSSRI